LIDFSIPKTKSLAGDKCSPVLADPKKLPISVLNPPVSLLSADTINIPTGTVSGNTSFVSLVTYDIVRTNSISRMTCFGVSEHLLYGYDYSSKLSLVMVTYMSPAIAMPRFQV
jgi:hypothetical protein